MADIFLLVLAAYDYSAISTVISGSHLAEETFVYSRRQLHLLRDAAEEGERNRIKGGLKLPLI